MIFTYIWLYIMCFNYIFVVTTILGQITNSVEYQDEVSFFISRQALFVVEEIQAHFLIMFIEQTHFQVYTFAVVDIFEG